MFSVDSVLTMLSFLIMNHVGHSYATLIDEDLEEVIIC